MRIEDLQYLLSSADRPGRSLLRVHSESRFIGVATESAGQIILNLPAPAAGFVRLWSVLTAIISTAVSTDLMLLVLGPVGGGAGQIQMVRVDFTAMKGGDEVPLIGALTVRLPTGVITGVCTFRGIDPLILGEQDGLQVICIVTAASGQTVTARGMYLDLPI